MGAEAPEALTRPGAALYAEDLLALDRFAGRRGRRGLAPVGPPGGFVARPKGRGLEAAEVRPMVLGDDPRHLDRNVSARLGAPHVREFHDEQEHTTLLIADFRPPMLWGARRAFRSVAAAEALAILGWRAIAEGGRVGLIVIEAADLTMRRPRARASAMIAIAGALAEAHRRAVTRALAAKGPEPAAALAPRLDEAADLAPRGARIRLATALDAPGDGFETALARLSARSRVAAILIADALEARAPAGFYRARREDGGFAALRIAPRRAPPPDPRRALLAAANAGVVEIDAGEGPEDAARRIDAWEAAHG